jgi:hypothetical protein
MTAGVECRPMANEPKPKADKDGMITAFPLLRQTTWKLRNGQTLLALEIAQNEQQLEARTGETIQILLTTIQAMDLARMLTDAGETPYREKP